MSAHYAGVQPRRSAGPAIALVIGIVVLLVGGALLAFAAAYEPTIENVLANKGEVLAKDDYDLIHAAGFVALAIGGFALLGGIVGLVARPAGTVPQVQMVPQPPYRGQPYQYPSQQPQWAPPPTERGTWPPPPDPAQRAG